MGKTSRKIQLEVPTSLADIKLGEYQRYIKVAEKNEGADEFLNNKLIEIFCDVTLRDVEKIPMVEAEKVISVIGKAFEETPELIRHFKLLDVDMAFIPKLDEISLGEFVDLENTISDWQQMHKAMAVLFRPVNFQSKDKYTIAPYTPSEDLQNIMKEMPMSVVMGAMVFFYDLGRELSLATLSYMEKQMEKNPQTSPLKEILAQSGVGINQYTHLLKEMSSNSMKLPHMDYLSV
jgi:hypothetical protein